MPNASLSSECSSLAEMRQAHSISQLKNKWAAYVEA